MLPKSGSLTSVKHHSLLYFRPHRTTPAVNSQASSAPPPSYLHNSSFPFPPSNSGSDTSLEQLGSVWPISPHLVTLETRTYPVNPRASPVPSPPSLSFP